MRTFRNEPTAAPRTNVNARKTNSWMDDNAIKSPGSVTFVYVESNAVHEKLLPFGGEDAIFKFLQAHRLTCAKVTALGG